VSTRHSTRFFFRRVFPTVIQAGYDSQKIVEYPKGRQMGSKVLNVTGLRGPVGITFDLKSNLVVSDYYAGILIYAPPYTGAPMHIIVPKGGPQYAKLDAANHLLYNNDYYNKEIDVYAYPSGTYKYSITNSVPSNPSEVAVGPGRTHQPTEVTALA